MPVFPSVSFQSQEFLSLSTLELISTLILENIKHNIPNEVQGNSPFPVLIKAAYG